MALDKATVARIATLARIRCPRPSSSRWRDELSHILGWIEQLNEVDTSRGRADDERARHARCRCATTW